MESKLGTLQSELQTIAEAKGQLEEKVQETERKHVQTKVQLESTIQIKDVEINDLLATIEELKEQIPKKRFCGIGFY